MHTPASWKPAWHLDLFPKLVGPRAQNEATFHLSQRVQCRPGAGGLQRNHGDGFTHQTGLVDAGGLPLWEYLIVKINFISKEI